MVNPKNALKKEEKKVQEKITSNIEYMEKSVGFAEKNLLNLKNQLTMMKSSLERIEFMINAVRTYVPKGSYNKERIEAIRKEWVEAYRKQFEQQQKEVEKVEGNIALAEEYLKFEVAILKELRGSK